MSQAFDGARARLYVVFAAPAPSVIEGCPCCIGTRKTDILLSKPLRELTEADLGRYGAGAFLTVGGERDFRYLLPRILEISATSPGWYPSPPVVLGKLRLAGWGAWSRSEREAVLGFLSAWFDRVAQALAADEGAAADVEELLCGLARADLDLAPYLQRLEEPEIARCLTQLAGWEPRDPAKPEGFWVDAADGWRRLANFLAPN